MRKGGKSLNIPETRKKEERRAVYVHRKKGQHLGTEGEQSREKAFLSNAGGVGATAP